MLKGNCQVAFAGGTGGIGRIVGPTGGYLLGFLPAVYLIGLISKKEGQNAIMDVVAMIAGTIVIYVCGVVWLKTLTGMTLAKTLAVGMYPFLIGDAIKIAAALPIVRGLRPIIKRT